jgi:rhodanese-related sulfurtransferase
MKKMIRLTLASALMFFPTFASAQDVVQEAFQEYTDFAPYQAGIILPAQRTDDVFDSFVFIDTRTQEEYEQATIAGAVHIEWREVFSRLDEVPTERTTILFCNTGALSAQSAFGLRVMGYENVLILQTGFEGWLAHKAGSMN